MEMRWRGHGVQLGSMLDDEIPPVRPISPIRPVMAVRGPENFQNVRQLLVRGERARMRLQGYRQRLQAKRRAPLDRPPGPADSAEISPLPLGTDRLDESILAYEEAAWRMQHRGARQPGGDPPS